MALRHRVGAGDQLPESPREITNRLKLPVGFIGDFTISPCSEVP
jgi:hypothetical protein